MNAEIANYKQNENKKCSKQERDINKNLTANDAENHIQKQQEQQICSTTTKTIPKSINGYKQIKCERK